MEFLLYFHILIFRCRLSFLFFDTMEIMKYHVVVYGCQMNYSDAARIKAVLNNGGREYVEEMKEADIVIIDTCSVRQKSEDKVWGLIKTLTPSPSPKRRGWQSDSGRQ